MTMRKITFTPERLGLTHVYVRTYDEDAGDVVDKYAGSIEDGVFSPAMFAPELDADELAHVRQHARAASKRTDVRSAGQVRKVMNMQAAKEKLQTAILRATNEHGPDNSFSFGELHTFHGGPPPMLAGRVAKMLDGHTIGHIPTGISVTVTIEGGRVCTKPT